jgi:hypothetical protein
MPDRPAVIQHALEPRPVQQPGVPLVADRRNRLPLLVARHPARRKRRVVQEDDARAIRDRGRQLVQIQSPLPVADVQRDQPRRCPNQPHPVEHARIGRVGEDDLVPGIGQAEQGVQHRVALATGDHDLLAPVVSWAAAPLDVGGHGLLEVVAAGERQPAVCLVLTDRGAGRRHCGGRGWDVGVEVLQAQNVGVVAGRRGDPVDAEPGDVLKTPDAHRTLLLSPPVPLTPGPRSSVMRERQPPEGARERSQAALEARAGRRSETRSHSAGGPDRPGWRRDPRAGACGRGRRSTATSTRSAPQFAIGTTKAGSIPASNRPVPCAAAVAPDRTKALARADIQALLAREDVGLRERVLWRLLYETAARAGEVLTLDVEDVDLDNKRVRVVSLCRVLGYAEPGSRPGPQRHPGWVMVLC